MKVDEESVEELFATHDVEGLIARGAPRDEYEPEMERLIEELAEIPAGMTSKAKIVGLLEEIWRDDFGATEEHLGRCQAAFESMADTLLKHYE